MDAQFMYDLREEYEFCSGNDLHEFFGQEAGEMSPSGKTKINRKRAIKFVEDCAKVISHNNKPGTAGKLAVAAAVRVRREK